MSTAVLEDYYQTLTIIGCILAAFLNLFAVPMAIRTSKYTLGSFKIIMLVFSTNNMLHIMTDTFVLPRFYFQDHLISCYTSGSIRYLEDGIATFGGVWVCVIFTLQVFLEALHYMYRYVVLCRSEFIYLLSVRNVSGILFISYSLYFLLFTAVFTLITNFDDEIYEAIGNNSLEKVGLQARELQGVVFYYARRNALGELSYNWKGCLGIFCVMGANTMFIRIMFYCGYRIHTSFGRFILSISRTVLEMNKTLFKMLIVQVFLLDFCTQLQTVIPLLLLHVPCVAVLVGPFFGEVGKLGELLIIAVLSYSIFEPLIVVYFLSWKRIKRLLFGGRILAVPSIYSSTMASIL